MKEFKQWRRRVAVPLAAAWDQHYLLIMAYGMPRLRLVIYEDGEVVPAERISAYVRTFGMGFHRG